MEEEPETKDKVENTVPNRMAGIHLLRFSATAVTMLAFAEIYVGLKAYLFKSNPDIDIHFVGAFWVGLYLILPGILGMLSTSKIIVIVGLITGLIGMCISFAGVVVDGSAFSIYKNLKACGHSSSNASIDINDIMVSGNTSYSAAAKYCAYWNPNFECSCSNDIIDIQTGPHPTCYVFNAGSGASFSSSCETLLTEYPLILESSFGICIVCLSVVFVFCCFSACSVLCPTTFDRHYVPYVLVKDKTMEMEQEELETGIIYQASPKKVQVERERSYELPQQNATEYFDEEPDTEDNFSDDKTEIREVEKTNTKKNRKS